MVSTQFSQIRSHPCQALEVGGKGDHDEGFEKEEVREVDDKNMFEIC